MWGGGCSTTLTPMRDRAHLTILKRVASDLPMPSMALATINELLHMSLSYTGDIAEEASAVVPYKAGR
eukprot:4507463-Amphidinium_carterae.2